MKAGTKQIDEAVDYLTAVRAIYPSRMNTLDLLADPRRGSDYDGNTRAGISDPTPTQAAQLEQYHIRQRNIRDNLILAVHHARMVWSLVNGIAGDINIPDLVKQARCTGGAPSLEPWVREECSELAVTRDGLCSACYQRRHHWRRTHPLEGAA